MSRRHCPTEMTSHQHRLARHFGLKHSWCCQLFRWCWPGAPSGCLWAQAPRAACCCCHSCFYCGCCCCCCCWCCCCWRCRGVYWAQGSTGSDHARKIYQERYIFIQGVLKILSNSFVVQIYISRSIYLSVHLSIYLSTNLALPDRLLREGRGRGEAVVGAGRAGHQAWPRCGWRVNKIKQDQKIDVKPLGLQNRRR